MKKHTKLSSNHSDSMIFVQIYLCLHPTPYYHCHPSPNTKPGKVVLARMDPCLSSVFPQGQAGDEGNLESIEVVVVAAATAFCTWVATTTLSKLNSKAD